MDSSFAPKARDDLVFRQLEDEWVVYDSRAEQLHVLNHSAAVVWLYCNGTATVGEIVDAVRKTYAPDVPREQVAAEVATALRELADRGLFE